MRSSLMVWLGLVSLVAVGHGGEPETRIPRDTLPAKLVLDTVPLGLDTTHSAPADNPVTEEKVRLGRTLFFDPVLSADRTLACASCHDPAHGFAGRDPVAIGIGRKRGTRNAPTLLNRAYAAKLFWDGREATLEAQALGPIENPLELGANLSEVVERLKADTAYAKQFTAAFPDGVTAANIGKALASFERTLLHGGTRVDQFRIGKIAALTAPEKHGLWLFESRAGCWKCHSGANFTDEKFHNTGVTWDKTPADLGRYVVTKHDADRGAFKTPTLRGVAHTAPYMHDGSLASLKEVVEFYNKGGNKNPNLDPLVSSLNLSEPDLLDLVAFLEALSENRVGEP
jgi:cytochrome c peroxidase